MKIVKPEAKVNILNGIIEGKLGNAHGYYYVSDIVELDDNALNEIESFYRQNIPYDAECLKRGILRPLPHKSFAQVFRDYIVKEV